MAKCKSFVDARMFYLEQDNSLNVYVCLDISISKVVISACRSDHNKGDTVTVI